METSKIKGVENVQYGYILLRICGFHPYTNTFMQKFLTAVLVGGTSLSIFISVQQIMVVKSNVELFAENCKAISVFLEVVYKKFVQPLINNYLNNYIFIIVA